MTKRKPAPGDSAKEQAAAAKSKEALQKFFSDAELAPGTGRPSDLGPEAAGVVAVQAKHEAELLRYSNVVGVAGGIRTKRGIPTGEPCLVVYVERKVPRAKLRKDDILPTAIEGVLVDVVAVGKPEPLGR